MFVFKFALMLNAWSDVFIPECYNCKYPDYRVLLYLKQPHKKNYKLMSIIVYSYSFFKILEQ